ncbi:MAG: DNA repair protein RadC [Gemmatimonadaceae bacterium]|nr:DNA repair protein RadC [Gemmatimonadaceae bacterium]
MSVSTHADAMTDRYLTQTDPASDRPHRIREIPPQERPRERLTRLGASALSAAELLALVIGSGSSRHSALDLAHHVLARHDGSLRRLAASPMASIRTVHGMGPVRAVVLHAALELGRRLATEDRGLGTPLAGPLDVYRHFAPRLEDLPVEEFHVAVLDTQHRLERDVTVTRGLLSASLVHPREVFREAIAERAASIILVHNHPSGDPTPSPDDRKVTSQLVAAGRLLDIPVHDHVIIGRGRYASFAESGLLG